MRTFVTELAVLLHYCGFLESAVGVVSPRHVDVNMAGGARGGKI
jgi:hypothetical protein